MKADRIQKVYLAGGCFWCICDYILSLGLDGIEDVTVGYCGGEEKDATYELVKSQKTMHRETVEISFDAAKISLQTVLTLFTDYVDIHDKDGQYIDRGHSYTLACYYRSEEEKAAFQAHIQTLEAPVYIAVEPFRFFVRAEEYHQHYGRKNEDKMMEELIASGRSCHIRLKNTIKAKFDPPDKGSR